MRSDSFTYRSQNSTNGGGRTAPTKKRLCYTKPRQDQKMMVGNSMNVVTILVAELKNLGVLEYSTYSRYLQNAALTSWGTAVDLVPKAK